MNQGGDYERRSRGLEALFRPQDWVDYDILRAEMVAGRAQGHAWGMPTPYIVLRAYAAFRGRSLGAEWDGEWQAGHVMGYLASAILVQGTVSRWPVLVISAYEELYAILEVLPDPNSSGSSTRSSRRAARRLRHSGAPG